MGTEKMKHTEQVHTPYEIQCVARINYPYEIVCGGRIYARCHTETDAKHVCNAFNDKKALQRLNSELLEKLKGIEHALTPDSPSGSVLPENISRARVLARATIKAAEGGK